MLGIQMEQDLKRTPWTYQGMPCIPNPALPIQVVHHQILPRSTNKKVQGLKPWRRQKPAVVRSSNLFTPSDFFPLCPNVPKARNQISMNLNLSYDSPILPSFRIQLGRRHARVMLVRPILAAGLQATHVWQKLMSDFSCETPWLQRTLLLLFATSGSSQAFASSMESMSQTWIQPHLWLILSKCRKTRSKTFLIFRFCLKSTDRIIEPPSFPVPSKGLWV